MSASGVCPDTAWRETSEVVVETVTVVEAVSGESVIKFSPDD